MAPQLLMKRMVKERLQLEQEKENYVCFFDDKDLLSFTTYIIPPEDSLFHHKLIQLQVKIPDSFPSIPPGITFKQYHGGDLHPIFDATGYVCLEILSSSRVEGQRVKDRQRWQRDMTIDSLLVAIRSSLSGNPLPDYPHYKEFAQFKSWEWLLFNYVTFEDHPAPRNWLREYLRENGMQMVIELHRQKAANTKTHFTNYRNWSEEILPDYDWLINTLLCFISKAKKGLGPVAPPE